MARKKQASQGRSHPRHGEPRNSDRAAWARRAVVTLQKETGLTEADGLDTAVTDLLADMMHLCRQEGLKFQRQFLMAEMHYEAERRGG